jgi:TatD DNase family protein
MYVEHAAPKALEQLREALLQHRADPKLIAVGEIGLDFFIPEISQGAPRAKQELFYEAQLKLALEFDLPVLLHVRRSQDTLLKYLRRHRVRGGLAHAFNGSLQQAQQFIELGFALGIGGAMTFERALQIRRLATDLDLSALVLETDAPDISPAWLAKGARNEPGEVLQIAQTLAELRGCSVRDIVNATARTTQRVCPRLAALLR